jgi:hypothetical protein
MIKQVLSPAFICVCVPLVSFEDAGWFYQVGSERAIGDRLNCIF